MVPIHQFIGPFHRWLLAPSAFLNQRVEWHSLSPHPGPLPEERELHIAASEFIPTWFHLQPQAALHAVNPLIQKRRSFNKATGILRYNAGWLAAASPVVCSTRYR